jgi:lipid-A-disaccharide synthase
MNYSCDTGILPVLIARTDRISVSQEAFQSSPKDMAAASQKHLLILTGDHSADMHAAAIVRALRGMDPEWQISGVGASAMRDAGVELIADHRDMNVLGPVGVIKAVPSHRKLARRILAWVDEHRPSVAMLVDYGMFHLWLGPRLRARGVKVIYFIPPQIWASRPWRVKQLRKAADEVVCILPFEPDYYRSRGLHARFVGNPLMNLLPPPAERNAFAMKHGLDPAKTWIGLFPGSRKNEINRLLAPQVDAVRQLEAQFPGRFQFVLAKAVNLSDSFFQQAWDKAMTGSALPIKVLTGENHAVLSAVDLALVASGTVTLEAALYRTPMIIMYRGSFGVYVMARIFITVDHIGMPNLLVGKRIIPELWQYDVTGKRIATETLRMLEPSRYQQAKADLNAIASHFANQDTPRQVASAFIG